MTKLTKPCDACNHTVSSSDNRLTELLTNYDKTDKTHVITFGLTVYLGSGGLPVMGFAGWGISKIYP